MVIGVVNVGTDYSSICTVLQDGVYVEGLITLIWDRSTNSSIWALGSLGSHVKSRVGQKGEG